MGRAEAGKIDWRCAVICAAVCLAQIAAPGTAAAKPGVRRLGPSEACPVGEIRVNVEYWCAAEFTLRGSNGYRITVSAELGFDSVTLTAEGHSGTAVYEVPGQVTARGIKARFGRLGRVSVRFRPSGRQRHVKVSKKCFRHRPPVVSSRSGDFVGTIRFRGERGYTQVSAHRAHGGIGDPIANTPTHGCEFHESNAERNRELESVSLEASPPGEKVSFFAGRVFGNLLQQPSGESVAAGKDPYLFLAVTAGKAGQMRIRRIAAAFGEPESFVFDQALTSATVSPPAPFTGSGSFLRNPDGSTSWTGTLAASMPGLGSVPLTGGKAELATVEAQLKQAEEEAKAPPGGST